MFSPVLTVPIPQHEYWREMRHMLPRCGLLCFTYRGNYTFCRGFQPTFLRRLIFPNQNSCSLPASASPLLSYLN